MRYADSTCIGCKTREELSEEILICGKLNYENSAADVQINYDWFYRNEVNDIVKVGKLLDRGMKERQRIVIVTLFARCCSIQTNMGATS